MGIYVYGLGKADATVLGMTETMDDVVGVFRAQPGNQNRLLVGLTVTVRVAEVKDFGGGADVCATVPGEDSSGHEESVGEDLAAVGHAVSIDVLQYDDLVVYHKPRCNVGVTFRGCDPQSALLIPCGLDGILDRRLGGEKVELQVVRNMKRFSVLEGFVGGLDRFPRE